MKAVELLLQQPGVVRAGWTLIHFLWQGTLIALLYAAVRGLAGRSLNARGRYLLACVALTILWLTPPLTFLAQSLPSAELVQPGWRLPDEAWSRTLPWLVVVWLAGVIVFSARLISGWRFTARLRSVAVGEVTAAWQRTLDELVARMRVSQPVRLLTSTVVSVPTVVGWLRPVILMPLESLTGLPIGQVRALLAHELAHIRRHDYLVNILQSAAEAMLFYHPAVWWISGQIRAEREACCDDLAVEVSGDLLTYVKALADLESGRRTRLAMAADGGSLLYRVRRLIGPPSPHYRQASGAAWMLTILWLAGIGAVTLHGAPPQHAQRRVFTLPASAASVASSAPLLPAPPAVHTAASHFVAALLFDPFVPRPQAPAPPPGGNEKPAKARVVGKVMGPSQEPLKKASVNLILIGGAAADQGPVAYSETTDDAGNFAIDDLPAGGYRLSANKNGYMAGSYGARTIGGPGATVNVKEGAEVKDLAITLSPQGTIAGRVTDSDGEPVPNARMVLYKSTFANGHRQTGQVRISQTTTNVQGRYTYHNIPPGRYYLGADVSSFDPPGYQGPKEVLTFYPSTTRAEDGVPLDVEPGSRIEGIDVRIRRQQVYTVKGKVAMNGAPVVAVLVLSTPTLDEPGGRQVASLASQDGTFQNSALTPGTYTLEVRPQQALGQGFPPMTGRLEFTVKDHDLDGLVLSLTPGIELQGSFALEGGEWSSLFGQAGAVRQPQASLESDVPWRRSIPKATNDDGTFRMNPVGADTYRVRVTGLPPGTYVKSMSYGTRDVTREPISLTGGGDTLRILVSSKAATISGVVRNPKDNNAPLKGVLVSLWSRNATPVDGARSVYTDQNGAFQFGNLAPGDYYGAAWEELEGGVDQNLEFLAGFAANPVTVAESAQQNIDVPWIGRDAIAKQFAKVR